VWLVDSVRESERSCLDIRRHLIDIRSRGAVKSVRGTGTGFRVAATRLPLRTISRPLRKGNASRDLPRPWSYHEASSADASGPRSPRPPARGTRGPGSAPGQLRGGYRYLKRCGSHRVLCAAMTIAQSKKLKDRKPNPARSRQGLSESRVTSREPMRSGDSDKGRADSTTAARNGLLVLKHPVASRERTPESKRGKTGPRASRRL
jgi:hypothetical protein